MLVGKDKRKAMAAKALEKEKEKKRAEGKEKEDKKKSRIDKDPRQSKVGNRNIEMDDSVSEENTMAEIEKEIENKELAQVVEEIMSRERYKFSLDSVLKRYFTCYDNEDDEMVKKTRRNGERKL